MPIQLCPAKKKSSVDRAYIRYSNNAMQARDRAWLVSELLLYVAFAVSEEDMATYI